MDKRDEMVILEPGVVRMTVRQLSNLWLEITDKASVDALIDIQQPETFTGDVDWVVYCNETEL